MSDSTSRLPARPSLEQLSKQAKELVRQYRAGERAALDRFRAAGSRWQTSGVSLEMTLADAQFVIAREFGFATWAELKHHIHMVRPPGIEQFEQLAQVLAEAYVAGDAAAIRDLNSNYATSFVWEHKVLDMQRRLPRWFASDRRTPQLALEDAQDMVAHSYGFQNWAAFAASFHVAPANPRSTPVFLSNQPPFYRIDWNDNRLTVRGPQSDRDWDTIFAVMKEHGIDKLDAAGITDAVMRRLPALDHVTELDVGGSKSLTDEGALSLARMPQLKSLSLGGWSTPITDHALAVLRHLPDLKRFGAGWTQGISDAGLVNLASCEQLEDVNLMGTPAGDGTIGALAGKPGLRRFRTGTSVTDRGIALLHKFPVFKTWHGGEIKYGLMSADSEPNFLLLDGPFTDAGLAGLVGLDGLFGLGFFWHCPAFTPAGLEPLKHVANLGFLGCQGKHCDNAAMRHIAAIPRLRMLMGQGAIADDSGFEELSRSRSSEHIWGARLSKPGWPRICSSRLDALPSRHRRKLQECGRCGALHLVALPRPSTTRAHGRSRRRFPPHRCLQEPGRTLVHVLPGYRRQCHGACCGPQPVEILLRGTHKDHGPQPGDSGLHGFARKPRILAVCGPDRRWYRTTSRAAESSRSYCRGPARRDENRPDRFSVTCSRKLHRLSLVSRAGAPGPAPAPAVSPRARVMYAWLALGKRSPRARLFAPPTGRPAGARRRSGDQAAGRRASQ
jgi:hypothetical protein